MNGYAIGTEELERYLRMLPPGTAGGPDAAAMSVLELKQMESRRRRDALRRLIELRVLSDRARDEYLAAPGMQKVLDRIGEDDMRKFEEQVGSKPAARRMLAQIGLTPEQYKDLLVQQQLATRLLWDKALSQLDVSPAEARRYYEEHAEKFVLPRTVRYRQILFVVVDASGWEARRALAEAVHGKLREGADFAALADRYSADAATYPGGLRSVALPDSMPDWLPPAVRGLAPGETSEVRRLAGGFSIARLEEVRPAGPQPFDEAYSAIKAALLVQKRLAARAEYVERLMRGARIEYHPAGTKLMGGPLPSGEGGETTNRPPPSP